MITCCELALYIALGAFVLILALFAMFFGYNLNLDARTVKLEKKNGKEQHQIDQLKKEVERLKTSKSKSSQRLKSKNG